MSTPSPLPADFVWGVATSSYQIEGAFDADGRGESIWDRFCATPGKIDDASTGDIACDHYHRYPADIALMRELGVGAYRFSIAWPRILPSGRGHVQAAGVDFYSRLVDALLEAGITPYATLYHWDLPQALQDAGGWPQRDTAYAFANYADVITRALGDRVQHWMTFNEPWCSATLGYHFGEHAPGHRDLAEMLPASHHLLLGHGLSLPIIRQNVPGAQVGLVQNPQLMMPASRSVADRRAAWLEDGLLTRWYLDPLAGRGYPADVVAHYGLPMDFVHPGDLDLIAQPMDFLGINYYTRMIFRSAAADNLPVEVTRTGAITEMDWEVYPDGLYNMLCRIHFDYGFPALLVTENGAAFPDVVSPDGAVHDPQRVEYLQTHVQAVARARAAGVPINGYFAWSLMDNFEWARGYTKRFGLIYVDYPTQTRTLKASAHEYRRIIQTRGG